MAPSSSPTIILSGPDPIGGSEIDLVDGSRFGETFSTGLQGDIGGEELGKRWDLTLIHADPWPTDPILKPTVPASESRIYTGFIETEPAERDGPWPIHHRGAEVTANLLKNLIHGRPPSPLAFLYPVTAMIEPTRRCNLACPICPVGGGRTHPIRDMPFEQFQKIIDQLKPFLVHLTLHNYGESFLHKDIYGMIRYSKGAGIPDVNVSTNGHVLDPSRLIESGLDELMISLDGVTQDTYAAYRRGGRLDKVIGNIRSLQEEKAKRRSQKPLLELQLIIMRQNQNQVADFRKLAAELGAERIRLKTFNLQMSGPAVSEAGLEFLPTHRMFTRYRDSHGRVLKNQLEKQRCKWPWDSVVINSDGGVVPCCNDFKGRHTMGNVFKQPFDEIWFGTRYNRFRRTMIEQWRNIPLCAGCPVPDRARLSFERIERADGSFMDL